MEDGRPETEDRIGKVSEAMETDLNSVFSSPSSVFDLPSSPVSNFHGGNHDQPTYTRA